MKKAMPTISVIVVIMVIMTLVNANNFNIEKARSADDIVHHYEDYNYLFTVNQGNTLRAKKVLDIVITDTELTFLMYDFKNCIVFSSFSRSGQIVNLDKHLSDTTNNDSWHGTDVWAFHVEYKIVYNDNNIVPDESEGFAFTHNGRNCIVYYRFTDKTFWSNLISSLKNK